MSDWEWNSASAVRPAKNTPVRDDWDDDDDDEKEPSSEENQKIWDKANSKPAAPAMPVIISRSIIAPAAFEPKMKILKRPQNNAANSSSQQTSNSTAESYKDKEARYQAARERIFGDESAKEPTEDAANPSQQKV